DPLATLLFKKYKEVIMPNLQVDEEGATLLINFIEHQSERERKKAAPFSAPAADQPHKGDVSLQR
ncbi:MAG TPA: hypothetical protein VFW31_12305, partial [Candidatus Angelobacter sp.]|nr:hypothetical protein [Candidatus Angelobacter sp.]